MLAKEAKMSNSRKWVPTQQRRRDGAEQQQQITVESGVPLPERNRGVYPWSLMKAGDSFTVECSAEEARNVARRLYVSGRAFCKTHANGLRVVTEQENEGRRVRVWLAKGGE